MKKANIGIMGIGVTGNALAKAFEKHYNLFLYDKYKKEYSNFESLVENSEIIFVCVPTPMKATGEIDLEYINDALKMLNDKAKQMNKENLVVVRSTIVPGTIDMLQKKYKELKIGFSPEFLTEKNSVNDMKNTDRVIIGASKEDTKKIESIYKKVFPKAKYILTDTKTAEMIKYVSNITLASQITIANEIYNICKTLGIEYNVVKEAILLDKRIGSNINVPGPDGNCGFGGKCFPKDLNALIYLSKQKGYTPKLLQQVWSSNLDFRKNCKDWLDIKGATSEKKFKSVEE